MPNDADRDLWIRRHLLEKKRDDDRYHAKLDELAGYIQQRAIYLTVNQKIYQSRSWRFTSFFRKICKVLSPVSSTEAELMPCFPKMSRAADGSWSTVGILPQFILPCLPMFGWVKIDFAISSDTQSRAHLYFDSGLLFNEAQSIDLGTVSKNTARQLMVRLENPTHCFRLDPLRSPGRFTIHKFRITPMAEIHVNITAAKRRLRSPDPAERLIPALKRCAPMLLRGQLTQARQSFRSILERDQPGGDNEYDRWCDERKLTEQDRQSHQHWAAQLPDPPLLSILVPTYNTPEDCLRLCVNSVLAQTYPHWELCIADDNSSLPNVRAILDELGNGDARIRVIYRKENGGISAATNTALHAATGSYIVLLDHDDELAPHALYAVATRLVTNPALDMIYSDEDKLSPQGRRIDPFFKPDWSPDFLLACMYTSHLSVYRTALVREIGGFRTQFDGAQDYDLVLRFTARRDPGRICHIPDVLYHWRMLPTSTASGPTAKPETWEAGRRVIAAHLADLGLEATVEPGPTHGLHHVRYAMKNLPLVSIIVPSACRLIETAGTKFYWAQRCIQGILQTATYSNVEVIVIGPATLPTELAEWFKANNVQTIAYELPFNFSQACNAGAAIARGEQLLFLNDDTRVRSADFLEEMLSLSQLPRVGAVGAKLLRPDGTLQHAGVLVLDGNPCHAFEHYPSDHSGYYGSSSLIRNWIAVTGACLMTRMAVFQSVNGFDLEFPMNYNDVDFCLRLRDAGYRTVCTPFAVLEHDGSASSDGHFPHETRLFHQRWLQRLPNDPFHNPNLSTRANDFRLSG